MLPGKPEQAKSGIYCKPADRRLTCRFRRTRLMDSPFEARKLRQVIWQSEAGRMTRQNVGEFLRRLSRGEYFQEVFPCLRAHMKSGRAEKLVYRLRLFLVHFRSSSCDRLSAIHYNLFHAWAAGVLLYRRRGLNNNLRVTR